MNLRHIYTTFLTSYIIFIASHIFFLEAACASKAGRLYSFSGQAMGTFYTIKFVSSKKESVSIWKKKIDVQLKEIDHKFSIFHPKGELHQFNQMIPDKSMKVSTDFYTIMLTAGNLYQITHGAWDGTVKPLVDLWGFGSVNQNNKIPGPDQIDLALSKTGFHFIQMSKNRILKKKADISLDLGSIAKGYGVDTIATLFTSSGIENLLVEIGGELYASGQNHKGTPWSVGISRPEKEYTRQQLFKIIQLKNQAIATSGNYRNYYEIDGKTYSHIIDPKTGYPVSNNIVSASVISDTCTFADGMATALMVMNIDDGISLVNSLKNTECILIEKKNNTLISHVSDNFRTLIKP